MSIATDAAYPNAPTTAPIAVHSHGTTLPAAAHVAMIPIAVMATDAPNCTH